MIDPSDPPPEFGEAIISILCGIIALGVAVGLSGPIWPAV